MERARRRASPTAATCDWESAQLERAGRAIARLFGYGSGWLAVCINYSDASASEGETPPDGLNLARRGKRSNRLESEGLHTWRLDRGKLTVPATSPSVDDAAALSFAGLGRPALDLLLVFGCEDRDAWLRIESLLRRARGTPNGTIAIRDAMARIMRRRAPESLEARARQLRIRAADYRAETRAAEKLIRARLLEAAIAFNRGRAPGAASESVRGRSFTLPAPEVVAGPLAARPEPDASTDPHPFR